MKKQEMIYEDPANKDIWICICKNTPCGGGFYACDTNGREVEPDCHWTSGLYVCFDCGRIINPDTMEVTGRNAKLWRRYLKREYRRKTAKQESEANSNNN